MIDPIAFLHLSPTTLADVLSRNQVMDCGIRPLWPGMARIAGPAYPVRCAPGDNLMLHAAIYRAPAGSVIVVQAGDLEYAVAGGNVCAVAQRRGIAGFVVDGLIRDVAEARANSFPVYARGVVPFPGGKEVAIPLNTPVVCGGVSGPGDIVVADEGRIAVIPHAQAGCPRGPGQGGEGWGETLDGWRPRTVRIEEIASAQGGRWALRIGIL
jgi:regulator of RNase E activity RraA